MSEAGALSGRRNGFAKRRTFCRRRHLRDMKKVAPVEMLVMP